MTSTIFILHFFFASCYIIITIISFHNERISNICYSCQTKYLFRHGQNENYVYLCGGNSDMHIRLWPTNYKLHKNMCKIACVTYFILYPKNVVTSMKKKTTIGVN